MAHPNELLIRRGYEAFAVGDMETVKGIFAPDIVFHVSGRNALSGAYKGIDEVADLFAAIAAMTDGTYEVVPHEILATDDHVVVLEISTGMRGTKRLHSEDIGIYHIKNGRVTEAYATTNDQHAFDEFWS